MTRISDSFVLYIVINGDYADLVTFTELQASQYLCENFCKFYSPM